MDDKLKALLFTFGAIIVSGGCIIAFAPGLAVTALPIVLGAITASSGAYTAGQAWHDVSKNSA